MQLTTVQLWERIHASGLATPEQCRVWARSVSKSAGAEALGDPGLLARELVALSILTPYQANVLFRGLSHPVRVGKVNVLRSLDAELGPAWYEGRVDVAAGDSPGEGDAVWVVALGAARLAERELQEWPPSLGWAESHCGVPADASLIHWQHAGASLQHLYVIGTPSPGGLLSTRLADGPLSAEEAIRWVQSAAEGLSCLHRAGLVHGHLSTAASWLQEDGRGRWLRDPLFPPRSAYHGRVPSLLGGQDERLALAAPELIAPGAGPTVGSDLYALGCLWYRCLVGQWPFDPGAAANVDVWGRLHAQVPVVPPDDLSESVAKCLMHLLAKDPAVRFASADAFLKALKGALCLDPTPLRERLHVATATPTTPSATPIALPGNRMMPGGARESGTGETKPEGDSKNSVVLSKNTDLTPRTNVSPKKGGKGGPKPSQGKASVPSPGQSSGPAVAGSPSAAAPKSTNGPNSQAAVDALAKATPSKTPTSSGSAAVSPVNGLKDGNPNPSQPAQAGSSKPIAAAGPRDTQPQRLPASQRAAGSFQPAVRIIDSPTPAGPRPINNPLLIAPKPLPGEAPLPGDPAESLGVSPKVPAEPSPSRVAIEGQDHQAAGHESAVVSVTSPADVDSGRLEGGAGGVPSPSTSLAEQVVVDQGRATPSAALAVASERPRKSPGGSNPKRLAAEGAGGTNGKTKKNRKGKAKQKGASTESVLGASIRSKRKVKRPVWFMPMVIGCSVLLLAVLAVVLRGGNRGLVTLESRKDRNPQTNPVETVVSNRVKAPPAAGPAVDPMAEYFVLKGDDGKSPWAPPTAGAPYSLEMLPMGLEAVAFLSNRVWMGRGPVAALLPWWNGIEPSGWELPEASWVDPGMIATVAVAWYPGRETGTYQRAIRLTLQEPKLLSEVVKEIDMFDPEAIQTGSLKATIWKREVDGKTLALGAEAFRAKPDQPIKRLTMGPVDLIASLASNEGRSSPMRRQMDALLQTTDGRADLTVLAAPSFLYGDGKELLGAQSQRALSVLRNGVDDNVQAVLFRTHFDPQWYMEWRTLSNDLQSAARDAGELKKLLEGLPDTIEARLNQQPADPYWRAIANRFPQMLRALAKHVRSASEDGQVVVNAYLPAEGLTNMVIASWMALQSDGNTISKGPVPKSAPPAALTVEQMLDAKISLRIEQESLEVVLQAIATELKDTHTGGKEALPMAINGTAFQKDGITRNQQIRGFAYTDTPVRELLTALCRKANPVTTVQSANEKDQKVVWILLEDPSTPSKKKLDMTTRAWSDTNQAILPKEFIVPTP
jgi:serine/threonine protein kinase